LMRSPARGRDRAVAIVRSHQWRRDMGQQEPAGHGEQSDLRTVTHHSVTIRTRHLVRAALLVVLAVVLAACGGSSSKAAAPSTTEPAATTPATDAPTTATTAPAALNACALVPQAKADAVIGATLEPGVRSSNSDDDSCLYSGNPNGPTAQVEVFVGAGAKTFYDDDNNVLHHTFTTVPGLGDESHEEDYTIFFRKGSTWVALQLASLDPYSTFKARLEALAKDVASQI
jgi:hypothetical protein